MEGCVRLLLWQELNIRLQEASLSEQQAVEHCRDLSRQMSDLVREHDEDKRQAEANQKLALERLAFVIPISFIISFLILIILIFIIFIVSLYYRFLSFLLLLLAFETLSAVNQDALALINLHSHAQVSGPLCETAFPLCRPIMVADWLEQVGYAS